MKSVKELEKELNSKVESYYKNNLGFKGSKGVYTFGEVTVCFSSTNYPGNINVKPRFSKNIDGMSDIYKLIPGMLPNSPALVYTQNHESVLSLGFEQDDRIFNSPSHHLGEKPIIDNFGYPAPHWNYYFDFEDGIDLQPFLDEHFYFYEKYIEPTFNKINTIDDLFQFYNQIIIDQPLSLCQETDFVLRVARLHRIKGLTDGLLLARMVDYPDMEELIIKYNLIYTSTPSKKTPVLQLHYLKKVFGDDYFHLLTEKLTS